MQRGLAYISVLCLMTAAVGQEQRAAPPYLPPETFFSAGRAAEFLPHAGKFLQLNPQDARAPRVALDMLMFATAMQDQEGQKDAKLRLLMDYGNTLPAAYLNRTSKPEDLRDLLKAYFTGTEKPLDSFSPIWANFAPGQGVPAAMRSGTSPPKYRSSGGSPSTWRWISRCRAGGTGVSNPAGSTGV